jgi:protease-4
LEIVNNAIRSALVLPGVIAAASLTPTTFGVADPDGVWSLQTNPAGLARMGGTELGLESGAGQIQSQDAIEGGWHGFAVGWDRLPGQSIAEQREKDIRFGYGGSLGRGFYAGLTGVRHEQGGASTGWSADLGLLWQPSEYLSLGWLLPNLRGSDETRSTGSALGISLRPTRSLDLQVGMEADLAGAAWVRPSWDDPTWEATARIRPVPWIALDARVDPVHPGRWGAGVSVQATPDLRLFARSAPAPEGSQFQAFGAHWTRQTRPSLGVVSPVLVYHLPGALTESIGSAWSPGGGLRKLRDDFRQMEGLEHLSTVAIDLGSTRFSPAVAGELRRQIMDLRAHGLKVYAWAHDLDMGTLYILSAADQAAIDPDGAVRTRGLAMDQLYFGKILKRHGVEVQVVKTGPWKSAMEPFEADHMSDKARDGAQRLLMDLDSSILAAVVAGRKVDPARLVTYIDTGSLLPRSAVQQRLVDTLLEESDLAKWAGVGPRGSLRMPLAGAQRETWGEGKRVEIVLLEGQIVDHEGEAGMVPWASGLAADRASALLDRLREDPSVGAVVLRVNSPGGSVSGSERLRRSVEKLAAAKPVAASFGAASASGAYLLSLPAGRIFAEPEGVVGSIGAFAAKVSVEGLLDSLGIHAEQVRTAPHAGAMSPFSRLDSLEVSRLTEFVDDAHGEFAGLVRKWRKMDSISFERVDGGKVFSGTRAVDLKLADANGDLDDAVLWARQRAGLSCAARVQWAEPRPAGFGAAMGMATQAASRMLGAGDPASRLQELLPASGVGVWAQAPWDPRWE